jgi:hypothetical protein
MASTVQLMYCAHIFSGNTLFNNISSVLGSALGKVFDDTTTSAWSQFVKTVNANLPEFGPYIASDSAKFFEALINKLLPSMSDSKHLILCKNKSLVVTGCNRCSKHETIQCADPFLFFTGSEYEDITEQFDQFFFFKNTCECSRQISTNCYYETLPQLLFIQTDCSASIVKNMESGFKIKDHRGKLNKYKPIGISIHSGHHYISYIKKPYEDWWYKCNDSRVDRFDHIPLNFWNQSSLQLMVCLRELPS